MVESPGFMAPGYPVGVSTSTDPAAVPDPAVGATPAPVAGAPDLGQLFSGTILGLPTWVVVGVAVYFLFFRKH
jgi:hypothetical protein